jgi:hypothetical protein
MLSGQSSHTSGVPGASAAAVETVAGQRFVVDLDQLGRIDRLQVGFRRHEGDAVADPAHPLAHQRGIARPVHGAAVAALHSAGHGQVAPPGGLPVGTCQYRQNAGRRPRLAGVDGADARVGMGRSQHAAERHARQHNVIDVTAAAPDQPRILETRYRLTNSEFVHQPALLRRPRAPVVCH